MIKSRPVIAQGKGTKRDRLRAWGNFGSDGYSHYIHYGNGVFLCQTWSKCILQMCTDIYSSLMIQKSCIKWKKIILKQNDWKQELNNWVQTLLKGRLWNCKTNIPDWSMKKIQERKYRKEHKGRMSHVISI